MEPLFEMRSFFITCVKISINGNFFIEVATYRVNNMHLRGLLGWRIKKLLNVRFFGDYYILGWGEPMAKIFGLWVN